jgi:hypothetical protein
MNFTTLWIGVGTAGTDIQDDDRLERYGNLFFRTDERLIMADPWHMKQYSKPENEQSPINLSASFRFGTVAHWSDCREV